MFCISVFVSVPCVFRVDHDRVRELLLAPSQCHACVSRERSFIVSHVEYTEGRFDTRTKSVLATVRHGIRRALVSQLLTYSFFAHLLPMPRRVFALAQQSLYGGLEQKGKRASGVPSLYFIIRILRFTQEASFVVIFLPLLGDYGFKF